MLTARRSTLVLVGLVAQALAACSPPTSKYSGQPEVVYCEDELRDRAAIDLDCEAAKVVVIPIGEGRLNAAVKGCEKKAVYVRLPGAWALNSQPAK